MRKVFCIGMNKTGTTSLAALLGEQTDLRTTHDPEWTIWTQTQSLERFRDHEVFCDGEWPSLEFLTREFPGSLYVLNTRALRSWLISRHLAAERFRVLARFVCRRYLGVPRLAAPLSRMFAAHGDAAMSRWTRIRNSYHRYARDFLEARREATVVLDLEGAPEDGLRRLAEHLDLEHLESTARNREGDTTVAGKIGDVLAKRPLREVSAAAVDEFLERSGLAAHAGATEVIDDPRWFLQGNHVDAVLGWVPELAPLQRALFRVACHLRRPFKSSTLLGLLTDQPVRMIRRELDPEGFLPVHRFSSGSA